MRSVLGVHWKDWFWAETPILWPPHVKSWLIGKDPDTGRDWWGGGEGDNRGWDGWIASPTWWTWVWVNSGSWWWTGRPGVLQFMGLQRVGHSWATELNLDKSLEKKVTRMGTITSESQNWVKSRISTSQITLGFSYCVYHYNFFSYSHVLLKSVM